MMEWVFMNSSDMIFNLFFFLNNFGHTGQLWWWLPSWIFSLCSLRFCLQESISSQSSHITLFNYCLVTLAFVKYLMNLPNHPSLHAFLFCVVLELSLTWNSVELDTYWTYTMCVYIVVKHLEWKAYQCWSKLCVCSLHVAANFFASWTLSCKIYI